MAEEELSRRVFVGTSAAIAVAAINFPRLPRIVRREHAAGVEETTISDLQAGLQSGAYTARSLVEQYTARIDAMDQQGPALNHIIELNPDALTVADQLDAERRAGKPRGPLDGIPILVKDKVGSKRSTPASS